jgi:hypothetical protein
MTIPPRKPKRPAPRPAPAPQPPKVAPPRAAPAPARLDDALLSLLKSTTFAPTDSIDVARAQGADAALQSVAREMPKYRTAKVSTVIRDETGRIMSMVTEEPEP